MGETGIPRVVLASIVGGWKYLGSPSAKTEPYRLGCGPAQFQKELVPQRCANGVTYRHDFMRMDGGPMSIVNTKKRPVQLTAEEERAREKALDFYRYVGKTDADATRLAWADIQKAFPRLKAYDSPTDVAE